MTRNRWHISDAPGRYLLARHWPARFDVSAYALFPVLRADRLARQVRQDLWRDLRGLRGFSPVVEVLRHTQGLTVRAGGRCDRVPPGTQARIAALLADPARRARWQRWAAL